MKKKILMALCLILALLSSLCGCSKEEEEAYRVIQVLEMSGSVSVERQDMGTISVYKDMRLESGDRITVGAESWLKIKMDEDKYILVEPDSVLRLEAAGNSEDSKTTLHLETGAVSNRLEEKLSDESGYEVNTPNSTMAVRGTVFRVKVTINEEGISVSDVSVYGGEVAVRLIHPDGTMDEEADAVLLSAGTMAQMWGNDELSRYVTTDAKLQLDDLYLKTLEFLQEALEAGQDLEIEDADLEALITALKNEGNAIDNSTKSEEETTESTKRPNIFKPPVTEPSTREPSTTEPSTTEPSTTEPSTTEPSTTEPSTTEPSTTEPATEETTETEPAYYTVTFKYNGVTFATQTVQRNATAEVPMLQPTASGNWNFDFTTPITQDTIIVWNEK